MYEYFKQYSDVGHSSVKQSTKKQMHLFCIAVED